MRAMILALGLIGAPLHAADQFDLDCRGTVKVGVFGKAKPDRSRYRVNIATREWCIDECTVIRTMTSVNSGMIEFLYEPQIDGKGDLTIHQVNRLTGEWKNYHSSGTFVVDEQGACSALPFSGFPTDKAKF